MTTKVDTSPENIVRVLRSDADEFDALKMHGTADNRRALANALERTAMNEPPAPTFPGLQDLEDAVSKVKADIWLNVPVSQSYADVDALAALSRASLSAIAPPPIPRP